MHSNTHFNFSLGLMCDLVWADPEKGVKGFAENEPRGCSYVFGEDAVNEFIERFDLDLVARAHEVSSIFSLFIFVC